MEQVGFNVNIEIAKALQSLGKIENSFDKVNETGKKVSDSLQKNINTGMEKVTSWTIAKGHVIANALMSAFGSMKQALTEHFPAMNQTFEMANKVMFANIVAPIAQELYPLLVKFMNFVRDNRDIFVKFGQVTVMIFKTIFGIISDLFKMIWKQSDTVWSALNNGKKTVNTFFQLINFVMFKLGFLFTYLMIEIEFLIEGIANILKFLFNNAVKPFYEGFYEGFMENIVEVLDIVFEALGILKEAFDEMGVSGNENVTWLQDAFKTFGKVMAFLVTGQLKLLAYAFKGLAIVIKGLVMIFKDPEKALNDFAEVVDFTIAKVLGSIKKSVQEFLLPFTESIDLMILKIENITNSIKEFFSDLWESSRRAFDGIVVFIRDLLLKYIDILKKKFSEWVKLIKDFIANWFELFKSNDIVKTFIDKIKYYFERLWFTVTKFKDNIKKALKDMFDIKILNSFLSGIKRLESMKDIFSAFSSKDKDKDPDPAVQKTTDPNKNKYTIHKGPMHWYVKDSDGKEVHKDSNSHLGWGEGSTGGEKRMQDWITRQGGSYRDGGIASGSDSGYPAMLHGTEAIIPLSKGYIPIKFTEKQQGAVYNDQRTININIESNKPDEVRKEVESAMKKNSYRDDFLKATYSY